MCGGQRKAARDEPCQRWDLAGLAARGLPPGPQSSRAQGHQAPNEGRAFSFGGSTQGVVNFPQGLGTYWVNFNLYHEDGDTNFPGYVTFTGTPEQMVALPEGMSYTADFLKGKV